MSEELQIIPLMTNDFIEVVGNEASIQKTKKKAAEARPSTAEEKLFLIETSIVRNNTLIARKKKENTELAKRAREIRKHLEALDKLI